MEKAVVGTVSRTCPCGAPGPRLPARPPPPSSEADVAPGVPASSAVLVHTELLPARHMPRAPFRGPEFSPASCFRWASKGLLSSVQAAQGLPDSWDVAADSQSQNQAGGNGRIHHARLLG